MLVYGATHAFMSNRGKESAEDLDKASDSVVESYKDSIKSCSSVQGLADVMREMHKDGLAIVGTRNYTYMTDSMATVLEGFLKMGKEQSLYYCNELTRSMGLREKYLELIYHE